MHSKGVSAAEVVMTVLHAGGKFDNDSYRVSAGLHGVGVSAVNAVSEWLKMEIYREGRLWYQAYGRGKPKAPLEPIGNTDRTGTKITFKPDPEIFSNVEFSWDILNNRLREISFLNASGFTIHLRDERTDPAREQAYRFEGGIREFVRLLSKNKTPLHDEVIYVRGHPRSRGCRGLRRSPCSGRTRSRSTCSATRTTSTTGRRHAPDRPAAALTKTSSTATPAKNLLKELKGTAVRRGRARGPRRRLSIKHPDPSTARRRRTSSSRARSPPSSSTS
jgi:DNA gyrase subunit B